MCAFTKVVHVNVHSCIWIALTKSHANISPAVHSWKFCRRSMRVSLLSLTILMLVGKHSKAANCVSFKTDAYPGTNIGQCTPFLKKAASVLNVTVADIISFKVDPSDKRGQGSAVCSAGKGEDKTFATSVNSGLNAGVLYQVCATPSKTPSKCQPPYVSVQG